MEELEVEVVVEVVEGSGKDLLHCMMVGEEDLVVVREKILAVVGEKVLVEKILTVEGEILAVVGEKVLIV